MERYRAQAIHRAASDWAESVLEHGDPALRTGSERFNAVLDDVLTDYRGAVEALREYGGHLDTCSLPAGAPDCDCGFDEAMLRALGRSGGAVRSDGDGI